MTALKLPLLEIDMTQYRYFWNKTQTFRRIAGSFTAYRVSRFDHDSSAWVFVAFQQVWFCLFDTSFSFFETKTYPGLPQAAWQTQIPHLQFWWLKTQRGRPCIRTSNFEAVCFPQNARVFKPPKSNPQEDGGWDCCSKDLNTRVDDFSSYGELASDKRSWRCQSQWLNSIFHLMKSVWTTTPGENPLRQRLTLPKIVTSSGGISLWKESSQNAGKNSGLGII